MSKRKTSGRSRSDTKHIRLYARLLESPAYRSLSWGARCLLIELCLIYNGSNNGRIALSNRDAAERLGCCKDWPAVLFDELTAKGFIRLRESGSFNSKGGFASEWTITDCPTLGQPATPPTREYVNWTGTDFEVPQRAAREAKREHQRAARNLKPGPTLSDGVSNCVGQGVQHTRTVRAKASNSVGQKRGVKHPNRPTHSDTLINQGKAQQSSEQIDLEEAIEATRQPKAISQAAATDLATSMRRARARRSAT